MVMSLSQGRWAAFCALFANFLQLSTAFVLFFQSKASFLAGSVLLSQSIVVIILHVPFLQDCRQSTPEEASVLLIRAAGVALAITGLAVIVTAAYESSIPLLLLSSPWYLLACLSLMITFWPQSDVSDTETLTTESAESFEPDNQETPLLADYQQPDEDSAELPGTSTTHEAQALPLTTSRLRGTRRLLQLATSQVGYLYAGCLVLLVRLPLSLSIPHFVATTLAACAKADFSRAQHEILYLLVAGTIDAMLDFWCIFLFGYANQKIVRNVRLDLFRHLLGQNVAFFDETSSGDLSSRLTSDCSEMASDLTWFFRFSIESVVRIVGITSYMLLRSPILGICAIGIAPVVAIINKLYGNWLAHNARQVQDALAQANAVAQQALASVRTVIAFAAEQHESERYESKIQVQYQLNVKQLFATGCYYMIVSTFLINTIVQGALLYIGMILIKEHELSAEVLLAFMLYQGQLQNETLNLFQSYSSLIKSSGAGDKVFALLDRKPPAPSTGSHIIHEQESGVNAVLSQNQYNVELRDVSFCYPSRPDHVVLDHFTLVIPKGHTVALVGSSGCGKTTVVNLLQRFYDPDAGSIFIDGMDLRRLNLFEHRKRIGVVTQDPVLFDGTVMDNIRYGSPSTTREQVVEAAKLANADGFICSFPQGYDTAVGERGVQLSGGQRQRIAIARAVVKQPSLLLLDEATSALDAESEAVVQDALDKLLRTNVDVTTVVIAHRLRTVQSADSIAVLHEGRVIECGTHNELLQNSEPGLYRRMIEQAGSSGVFPVN